jgi:hypothetical protein
VVFLSPSWQVPEHMSWVSNTTSSPSLISEYKSRTAKPSVQSRLWFTEWFHLNDRTSRLSDQRPCF